MADASIAIALKFLDQATLPMKNALTSIEGKATSTASSIGSMYGSINKMFGAVIGYQIVDKIAGVSKSFVTAAAEMEKYDILLQQVTGSTRNAEAAFTWIQEQGAKGFGIQATTDAFVKFKAIGLDPLDGSLATLQDALSAFGKTGPESLKLATVAITQMAGKGVISMEELRQQLAEQIPTSAQIMARELGMSYSEMIDKISKGQLSAKEGLTALFSGLAKDYGGMTDKMGNTWDGLMAKLSSAWYVFRVDVMESDGLFGVLKSGATELYNEVMRLKKDGTLKEWASDIAEGVVSAFKVMATAAFAFGEAVTNVKAAWYGAKSSVLESRLENLQGDARFISNHPFIGDADKSAQLKENVAEQERLIELINEASGALSGTQDQQDALVSRFDGILTKIEELRAKSYLRKENVVSGYKPPELAGAGTNAKDAEAAYKSLSQIKEDGHRIEVQNYTDVEKYNVELARLKWYLDANALSQEGYNRAVESAWRTLVKAAQAGEGYQESLGIQKEMASIYNETRTSAEKYTLAVDRLNYVWAYTGSEDADTYLRKLQEIDDQYGKSTDKMSEFAVQAARNIQDALGDTLYNTVTGRFDDIGSQFTDLLARMASQAAAAGIGNFLFGDFGATNKIGGVVGDLGKWMGKLLGFAGGGSVPARTPVIVGERGPELFYSNSGGTIVPNASINRTPDFKVSISNAAKGEEIEKADITFDGESYQANIVLRRLSTDRDYLSQFRQIIAGR